MILDRIKEQIEEEKELKRQEYMKNYVYKTADILKEKDYFNKVWKKYTFDVSEGYFDMNGKDSFIVGVEVQATQDLDDFAGMSVDGTYYPDTNELVFSIIPCDNSRNTDNMEEPFVAYEEWYKVALGGSVDNTQQIGDFDKLLVEIERITNKKVAKQVKVNLEKVIKENYNRIMEIINENNLVKWKLFVILIV